MAEQPQDFQVQLTPTLPPSSAIFSNVCFVNRIGQSVFLDFASIDPLALAARQPENTITASHVGRIVMAEDAAIKLRNTLNQILGPG